MYYNKKTSLQILDVSFVTLFIELMIIRWVPEKIRLIDYHVIDFYINKPFPQNTNIYILLASQSKY